MFSTSTKIGSPHEVVGVPLYGKSWIHPSESEISLTTLTEELGMVHTEPAPKGCSSEIVLTGSEVQSPTSLISLCKGKFRLLTGFSWITFQYNYRRIFHVTIGSEMRQRVLCNY